MGRVTPGIFVGRSSDGPWSPFKRNGKLRITFYDDPWLKRLWARLRGEPLWHRLGALRED